MKDDDRTVLIIAALALGLGFMAFGKSDETGSGQGPSPFYGRGAVGGGRTEDVDMFDTATGFSAPQAGGGGGPPAPPGAGSILQARAKQAIEASVNIQNWHSAVDDTFRGYEKLREEVQKAINDYQKATELGGAVMAPHRSDRMSDFIKGLQSYTGMFKEALHKGQQFTLLAKDVNQIKTSQMQAEQLIKLLQTYLDRDHDISTQQKEKQQKQLADALDNSNAPNVTNVEYVTTNVTNEFNDQRATANFQANDNRITNRIRVTPQQGFNGIPRKDPASVKAALAKYGPGTIANIDQNRNVISTPSTNGPSAFSQAPPKGYTNVQDKISAASSTMTPALTSKPQPPVQLPSGASDYVVPPVPGSKRKRPPTGLPATAEPTSSRARLKPPKAMNSAPKPTRRIATEEGSIILIDPSFARDIDAWWAQQKQISWEDYQYDDVLVDEVAKQISALVNITPEFVHSEGASVEGANVRMTDPAIWKKVLMQKADQVNAQYWNTQERHKFDRIFASARKLYTSSVLSEDEFSKALVKGCTVGF